MNKKIPFLIIKDPKQKTVVQKLSNQLKVGDLVSRSDYTVYKVTDIISNGYCAKLYNVIENKNAGYFDLKNFKKVNSYFVPVSFTPFKFCIQHYGHGTDKFAKLRQYSRTFFWYLFLMPWRI